MLQHISSQVLRDSSNALPPWRDLVSYVDGWSQFDGPEYLKIAENGYWYQPGVRSPVVWFPVYPMLVRAAGRLIDEPILAGILVASIGGLIAAGLYWRWLKVQGCSGDTRLVAFLLLMLYPYAWYLYGVVHSDAVFLAAALAAFLCVENRRYLLAGLAGAVASATRPTGMAVVAALVVLALERDGVLTPREGGTGRIAALLSRFRVPTRLHRSQLRAVHALPLLAICGVGGYMLYLGLRFGDPQAFRTNQTVYHPSPLPWLKLPFFQRLVNFPDDPTYALTIAAQAMVAVVVLAATPFVGRRFGWGYALFTFVLVAIPMVSTADFMGTGRYMIAAFPVWALLGEWLARQRYRWWWLTTSGTAMALLSMGFARSWYLT